LTEKYGIYVIAIVKLSILPEEFKALYLAKLPKSEVPTKRKPFTYWLLPILKIIK
jgi:hypothetical protein